MRERRGTRRRDEIKELLRPRMWCCWWLELGGQIWESAVLLLHGFSSPISSSWKKGISSLKFECTERIKRGETPSQVCSVRVDTRFALHESPRLFFQIHQQGVRRCTTGLKIKHTGFDVSHVYIWPRINRHVSYKKIDLPNSSWLTNPPHSIIAIRESEIKENIISIFF